MKSTSSNPFFQLAVVFNLILLLSGCGSSPTEPQYRSSSFHCAPGWEYRMFVNDSANNDSLINRIKTGVLFAMSPGVQYRLNIKGPNEGTYRLEYTGATLWGKAGGRNRILANFTSTGIEFALSSEAGGVFFGQLYEPSGATIPVSDVNYIANAGVRKNFNVRVLMTGRLSGMLTNQQRAGFFELFSNGLQQIFSANGFTVDTVEALILGDPAQPVYMTYHPDSVCAALPIPETKSPNAIDIYLIEKILSPNQNQTILGYTQRESAQFSLKEGGRIILSNLYLEEGAGTMASTAAHEIGHAVGLRHTIATSADLNGEKDFSNKDDGFSDTKYCQLQIDSNPVLSAKDRCGISACLYVKRVQANCPVLCGADNLMFPYSCSGEVQAVLSPQQRGVVEKNLAIMLGDK